MTHNIKSLIKKILSKCSNLENKEISSSVCK